MITTHAHNLTISEDVIGIIAGLAAAEVEGVSGMTLGFVDGINQILGSNKKYAKGVKVELEGSEVVINLYVIVKYGVKIPEVAFSIQTSVKNSVEGMTGLKVKSVNTVNVNGKLKRQGKTQGYTSDYKKAIVTLTSESKPIEFFESLN